MSSCISNISIHLKHNQFRSAGAVASSIRCTIVMSLLKCLNAFTTKYSYHFYSCCIVPLDFDFANLPILRLMSASKRAGGLRMQLPHCLTGLYNSVLLLIVYVMIEQNENALKSVRFSNRIDFILNWR